MSGPAGPASRPRPARPGRGRTAQPRLRTADRGLIQSLPAAVGRLSEHRLIDRLVAGKTWIGVVAFALIGIVTLQLMLLTLNRSIGRDLAREGILQQQNSALSVQNAELAIGERIQHEANALGMTLIPAGALRFLSSHAGSAHKAVAALAAPVQEASPEASSGSAEAASGTQESEEPSSSAGGEASSSNEATSAGEGTTGEAARSSETSRPSEAGTGEGESHTATRQAPPAESPSQGGTGAAPAG